VDRSHGDAGQNEGAAGQRIRAEVGVEWLSVDAVDRSGVDAEARRIGVAAMWVAVVSTRRRGGSEWRKRGGAVDWRHGDAEVWLVVVLVGQWRCKGTVCRKRH
jgi:hypothetical protein